ncbi:hypothetical protein SERLA73DRAFT_180931 [Serpula lacrymans var. lacrymans S7.3]|uniref:DUF7918 domain-containing protein n=2 Tax=Serpula lacrymans var. lacrymans TaxID=341189 RepID=F8PWN5_SERL3|nr:uncharacterized protein SERLADRAFT_466756 [Serpula lacrymans var. lacrymans S7.9]EGO00359.1 hypothetical protein SERLA73DRAFT_180931 [Serpula lacrymans var. lacrymans S7.3]EGO25919.1 hypothetical protein SERLADRAFT_466756 [Serpula lacrymans var. lacrymans S7.9]
MICSSNHYRRGSICETSLSYVQTSSASIRHFVFSEPQFSDMDDMSSSELRDQGQIKLVIWKANVFVGNTRRAYPRVGPTQTIRERSRNVLAHCIGFDKEEETEPMFKFRAKRLDRKPLATFIFRYRSLEVLQARGVIPRNSIQLVNGGGGDEEYYVKLIQSLQDTLKAAQEKLNELQKLNMQSRTTSVSRKKARTRPSNDHQQKEVIDLT